VRKHTNYVDTVDIKGRVVVEQSNYWPVHGAWNLDGTYLLTYIA